VGANGKRWLASVSYDSKRHNLGIFDTKQEAALAYDRVARQCVKKKPLNYDSIKAAEEAAAQAIAAHTLAHPPQPKPRPASGFYGVYAGERWKANIKIDGREHALGRFDTAQEAALAYDRRARGCGEDKPLNYASIKAAEEAAAKAQAEYTLKHPPQPKPRPPSGFHGVYAHHHRWQAQITYDGKKHHLGYFNTEQEAALTYDKEARQCGEEKLLNYDSIKAAEEAAVQAQASSSSAPQKPPQ
jgi:hypothetical protein